MIQKRFVAKITSLGELDLSFWQNHLNKLLDYMEERGYCNDYRKKVYFHARRIAVLSQDICWNSYKDIWEWYSSHTHGERYLHDVRAILGILAEYHLYGSIKDTFHRASKPSRFSCGNLDSMRVCGIIWGKWSCVFAEGEMDKFPQIGGRG